MTNTDRQWVSLDAVARILAVHAATARKILDRSTVRVQRLPGTKPRYHSGDVAQLLAKSISQTKADPAEVSAYSTA